MRSKVLKSTMHQIPCLLRHSLACDFLQILPHRSCFHLEMILHIEAFVSDAVVDLHFPYRALAGVVLLEALAQSKPYEEERGFDLSSEG